MTYPKNKELEDGAPSAWSLVCRQNKQSGDVVLPLICCFLQGMPIQYLVLEDTDEVITLVEDKNKVKQIQEDEQEEEEEDEDEKENNNQGVQLIK